MWNVDQVACRLADLQMADRDDLCTPARPRVRARARNVQRAPLPARHVFGPTGTFLLGLCNRDFCTRSCCASPHRQFRYTPFVLFLGEARCTGEKRMHGRVQGRCTDDRLQRQALGQAPGSRLQVKHANQCISNAARPC